MQDTDTPMHTTGKTLGNNESSGTKENVPDVQFAGEPDLFKLLSKSWSNAEGWMKSTKAMDVPGGVVIQVSTQQGDNVAEALCHVPGLKVVKIDGIYKLKRSDWSPGR